jgi:hypothetical protein
MSGRGRGRGRGRGQRGGRNGRGSHGRGNDYSGNGAAKAKGLCQALGSHVLDYGQKAAAEQMRTTFEKMVQYVGATFSSDISNELHNRMTVVLQKPEYSQEIQDRHSDRITRVAGQRLRLEAARQKLKKKLEDAVLLGEDLEAQTNLAYLETEIEDAADEASRDLPVELNDWRRPSTEMHGGLIVKDKRNLITTEDKYTR